MLKKQVLMAHLTALRLMKTAKLIAAGKKCAEIKRSSGIVRVAEEFVLREIPELRKCPAASKFFTYDEMAEGGMAFLTPGFRKTGAVYDEAKAAAADATTLATATWTRTSWWSSCWRWWDARAPTAASAAP